MQKKQDAPALEATQHHRPAQPSRQWNVGHWPTNEPPHEWVAKDPSFLYADSEDSDQTGRTLTLLVFSRGGSYILQGQSLSDTDTLSQVQHFSTK